ncbi:hypothetical protein G9A89_012142 [Geosiphon pyriformis]|nr:hypothetical protein G9A89_012142 [Geosiphon pyriformis]
MGIIEPLDILESNEFGLIYDQLLSLEINSLSVYMDESLKDLGSINMKAGAVVFFKDISLGLRVRVFGLMSSTLAKLQVITLVFECVPPLSSISVFMDS